MLSLLLALGLQAASQVEARSLDHGIQTFRDLCVTPLPDPERFRTAMNAAGVRWQLVRRTPEEVFGTGNIWESALGRITYRYNRETQRILMGPACHFEFIPAEAVNHDDLQRRLAAALSLPEGRSSGSGGQRQTRWDVRFGGGMPVRLFVSTNIEFAGSRGVRLSISRRSPEPVRAGEGS
jgi:hypothetical protein